MTSQINSEKYPAFKAWEIDSEKLVRDHLSNPIEFNSSSDDTVEDALHTIDLRIQVLFGHFFADYFNQNSDTYLTCNIIISIANEAKEKLESQFLSLLADIEILAKQHIRIPEKESPQEQHIEEENLFDPAKRALKHHLTKVDIALEPKGMMRRLATLLCKEIRRKKELDPKVNITQIKQHWVSTLEALKTELIFFKVGELDRINHPRLIPLSEDSEDSDSSSEDSGSSSEDSSPSSTHTSYPF